MPQFREAVNYFSFNAQLLPSVNYSLIRPCFPQCASFTSPLLHTSLRLCLSTPSLLSSFVSWLCVVPYWVSKRFTRITILIGIWFMQHQKEGTQRQPPTPDHDIVCCWTSTPVTDIPWTKYARYRLPTSDHDIVCRWTRSPVTGIPSSNHISQCPTLDHDIFRRETSSPVTGILWTKYASYRLKITRLCTAKPAC